MAGAEFLRDIAVVPGALIGVFDHQLNRGAGGAPFVDARQDANLVRLLALGGEPVLAGFAPVEPGLDVVLGQRKAWGAAVYRGAKGRAVAFAPGRHAEHMPESVEAHREIPLVAPFGLGEMPRLGNGEAPNRGRPSTRQAGRPSRHLCARGRRRGPRPQGWSAGRAQAHHPDRALPSAPSLRYRH